MTRKKESNRLQSHLSGGGSGSGDDDDGSDLFWFVIAIDVA